MKRILAIVIGVAGVYLAGCAGPRLAAKPWHASPSHDPRSSTVYPFVAWSVVQELKPGMTASQAEALIHDLQSHDHPVNAIVFTEFHGRGYEIALKLSPDNQMIEDISLTASAVTEAQNMAVNPTRYRAWVTSALRRLRRRTSAATDMLRSLWSLRMRLSATVELSALVRHEVVQLAVTHGGDHDVT